MRVYGVDFTSAPSRSKPLTCAVCNFDGNCLRLEKLQEFESFSDFEALLDSPGPWIMGADFPFGQPRKFIENMDWPPSWDEYVRHVDAMGKEAFEKAIRDYVRGRCKGDMYHKRCVDRLAKAQAPMKLDFIPVGKMFFQGAPRLLKADVSVLPCRPKSGQHIVVEAYPALVARRAVGKRSYKDGRDSAGKADRKEAREDIIAWLRAGELRREYGFRVQMDADFRKKFIEDDRADLLDSLLCAIQAAWAHSQRKSGFGIPTSCDLLEGWIPDPGMREPEMQARTTRKLQYITDHTGRKTAVILPIREYYELLEDLDDLASIAERRSETAIPHEKVVARVMGKGRILRSGRE